MVDEKVVKYYVDGLSRDNSVVVEGDDVEIFVKSDRGSRVKFDVVVRVLNVSKSGLDGVDAVMRVYVDSVRPILKLVKPSRFDSFDDRELKKYRIVVRSVFDYDDCKYSYEVGVVNASTKTVLYKLGVVNNKRDIKKVEFVMGRGFFRSKTMFLYDLVRFLTLLSIMDREYDASNIGDDVFSLALMKQYVEGLNVSYFKSLFTDKLIVGLLKSVRMGELKVGNRVGIVLHADGTLCFDGVRGFSSVLGLSFLGSDDCRSVKEVFEVILGK